MKTTTSNLSVHLFGKLSVRSSNGVLDGLSGSKVQQLFCYLMLNRRRPQSRERLANLLWPDASTTQSRKYLRQALWQLQAALRRGSNGPKPFAVDAEWVQYDPACPLWLDIAVFEDALDAAHRQPEPRLTVDVREGLRNAVTLYSGHLLEGWYQDWCLRERERLQEGYLSALDKLIADSESRHDWETALSYGALSLRCDAARERTHRCLMRLHYSAGDRAAALRQFDRCILALDEELGVKPAPETEALYETICCSRALPEAAGATVGQNRSLSALSEVLSRLRELEVQLAYFQRNVKTNIVQVEAALAAEQRAQPSAPRLRPPLHVAASRFPARAAAGGRTSR